VISRYVATVDQKALGPACQRLHLDQAGAAEGGRPQPLCARHLEMGRGAGMLSDDRQSRLSLARRRRRPSSYEAFLKNKLTRLDGIASIESSFALSQVKYSIALPV
jgi:Lrp/AsnC family leucine-responsive transcriptional regulator